METFARGLLPLSADPITLGHMDLIRRAKERSEALVVLICQNDEKRGRYLFSLEERRHLAEHAVRLAGLKNVTVRADEGLLVDAFLHEGCDVVFRGIRHAADRASDEEQMRYHDLILPGFSAHVVYLESRAELQCVSSTLAKAFTLHHVDTSPLVPVFVKQALEERLSRQWKIGVTGSIASGKTWVSTELVRVLREKGVPAHRINIDELLREVMDEPSPGGNKLRVALAELLGGDVLSPDGLRVNRERMKSVLFAPDASPSLPESAHRLTTPHVWKAYREAQRGLSGVIVIEWAMLAEMTLSHLVNHHVIHVTSPDREQFLRERGIAPDRARVVNALQWNDEEKRVALEGTIRHAKHGYLLPYTNERMRSKDTLPRLAEQVLRLFPTLKREKTA